MTDVMAWRLGAGWSDDPSPVIRLQDDDWDDDEDWDDDDWEDDEDWDDEDWEDDEDWDEDDASASPSDDDRV